MSSVSTHGRPPTNVISMAGSVLGSLLEAHQKVNGGLGMDHLFQTTLQQQHWMLKGLNHSESDGGRIE